MTYGVGFLNLTVKSVDRYVLALAFSLLSFLVFGIASKTLVPDRANLQEFLPTAALVVQAPVRWGTDSLFIFLGVFDRLSQLSDGQI